MKFKKMHGAGNDYVFVDARNKTRDWPKVAAAVSDRHKGIGSDGLIILLPSEKADVRMQMFNADGSQRFEILEKYVNPAIFLIP